MLVREETIITTADVRVRILELAPGETGPWHNHSEVSDNMFCLSGTMLVRLRNPSDEKNLRPGERCVVPCGRVHQVSNPTAEGASYLLVQGVGRYDFNVKDDSCS